MTAQGLAALFLAVALMVLSSSPRRRLAPPGIRRRPRGRSIEVAGAGAALAAVVMLPSTTVLATGLLGATLARRHRRRRLSRRAADEGRMLQTALDVLVGELRVGAHPVHAFGVAADETDGAVAAALRAVAARATLGADVTTGLRAAASSSALPAQWERFAICWQLASEQGLAIAALMRAAQRDIAERQRFSARVASGLAGARATATILACLPVLGVGLGELIGARPLRFLLDGHAGGWLLAVGMLFACLGMLWSDRITGRVAA